MRNISFKNTVIILCAVIVCIFGIYYLIYRDIAEKNRHVSSFVSGLSLQNVKQEYLSTTTAFLNSIDGDIMKIKTSILPSDGDVKFIEDFESMARDNGLSISINSLVLEDSPLASANGVVVFNIKAKTTGSWAGVYTFLEQMESLPIKIKVKNFKLSDTITNIPDDAAEAPKSTDKWQSSFEIEVLKYK